MFRYLREYRIEDMKAMMRNTKTPHHTTNESMRNKTAVVTGATSGVGLSAAERFAEFGCDLVLVARNIQKAEAVGEMLRNTYRGTVKVYYADFTHIQEVKAAAEKIVQETDKIDILVNSAGIHSTTRTYTPQGFESVFCVNYLASFVLTYLLIPMMKKNASARILQVNSQGHRFNGFNLNDLNWKKRLYTGLRGYGASKTAGLLSVWEFADRLADSSVTINAMHPGEVRTNIGSNNGALYNWYLHTILWKSLKDVKMSGESLHYLAAAAELDGISGKFFNLTHQEKPAPHALDRQAGAVLWEKTLEMTGLENDL